MATAATPAGDGAFAGTRSGGTDSGTFAVVASLPRSPISLTTASRRRSKASSSSDSASQNWYQSFVPMIRPSQPLGE